MGRTKRARQNKTMDIKEYRALGVTNLEAVNTQKQLPQGCQGEVNQLRQGVKADTR